MCARLTIYFLLDGLLPLRLFLRTFGLFPQMLNEKGLIHIVFKWYHVVQVGKRSPFVYMHDCKSCLVVIAQAIITK